MENKLNEESLRHIKSESFTSEQFSAIKIICQIISTFGKREKENRTMKKIGVWAVLWVLLIAVIAGADEPRFGGTLILARDGDSMGLDPAFETDGNSFMVCDNIFEQLLSYSDETTDIVPGLAVSWNISEDGLAYTFHLRKGVRFHDGTEMNADAVVFSIGRMMKEKNAKFFKDQWTFPEKQPPAEYWLSMEMDKTVDSIEAKDNETVIFKLKRRDAPFIANMAMNFAAIVSPTAVSKLGETFKNNPVGTGSFRFVKWMRDERIILEANKEYWGGKPYLEQVIFRAIPDNSVRFLELKAGNADICLFPNPEDIELAQKDINLKIISQPGLNIGYIGFNHTKSLWQDKRIRQAFAYGINKKAITDNIYSGMGQAAKNTIPPTVWSYNDDIADYPYNPEIAKKLLSEAKFFDKLRDAGQNKITLWNMPVARPYNPNSVRVGEAIQSDLKKLGIDIEPLTFEWGIYLKKQRTQPQDMDMFQLGWTGDNGDPDNFLSVLLDGMADPNIRNQWKNQEYHDIMIKAREAVSKKERIRLYRRAQELIHEEVPLLNIAHSLVVCPMKQKVMNFKLHPTSAIRMHRVWMK